MEYYDDRALFAIGDLIGMTLKIDGNIELQARGMFARVCVVVGLG